MPLRRCFDAAWPPTSPPDWEAVAGYIGGNTPHVWTDAEWERQPARWRLPIFVRSHDGDPAADAAFAIGWLRARHVPKGCTLALDYETRVDAAYLATFDQAVTAAGWRVMVYGSRGTVFRNPKPSGGYWDADWPSPGETAHPHLSPGSAATQWSGSGPFGGAYDPSLVADDTRLWDTQPTVQEDDVDYSQWPKTAQKELQDDILSTLHKFRTERPALPDGTDGWTLGELLVFAPKILAAAVAAAEAADPAALAALLAGTLEITGIHTEPGGVVTVTFGPKVAA